MASEALKALVEQRDAAYAQYESFAQPILDEKREMTDEEKDQRKDLRKAVKKLDDRILEVEQDEVRAAEIAEARKRILGDEADKDMTVTVKSEPRTYGPDSENSYFADFIRSSSPMWPGHHDANDRLRAYAAEVAGEMRDPNSAEGKRARKVVLNAHREDNRPASAKSAVDRAAAFTRDGEFRTGMDTTSGSGGSFVTPQYFVADYAPFRQFGRVFADQANKQDLPSYGMTIYLPSVSAAAGVASQSSQNTAIQETDPTAGYLSTNLTTNAGQVTVSQQLLDRAGPNFAFDKMVFDQLQRAYNLTLDTYVLTQALATAGAVAYTGVATSPTIAGLLARVAQAKANIADTAGTVLPATHTFWNVAPWEWATIQTDTTGRTLVTPDYAGPFNAFAAAASGAPNPSAEGDTGYKFSGLPVFEDNNIPETASQYQFIVAHMPEVWFWEGDLVPRVVPQTLAQDLSVLLQVYAYVGAIVRYPQAVQAITGTQVAASKFSFAVA